MSNSDLFVPPKINAAKSLLKNQAYDIIKSAIMNNHLKPDKIYSQEFLGQSLGISRTPVREALIQLQLEGIVHIYRGRGMQIVTTTQRDLRDILEMSDAIECKICQLAAQRITDEILQTLEEIYQRQKEEASKGQIDSFMEQDRHFHLVLATATDNKKLMESVESIHEQLLRSGIFVIYNIDNLEMIIKEHRGVIDAMYKHCPVAALEAMRIHIDGIFSRAMHCISQIDNGIE